MKPRFFLSQDRVRASANARPAVCWSTGWSGDPRAELQGAGVDQDGRAAAVEGLHHRLWQRHGPQPPRQPLLLQKVWFSSTSPAIRSIKKCVLLCRFSFSQRLPQIRVSSKI